MSGALDDTLGVALRGGYMMMMVMVMRMMIHEGGVLRGGYIIMMVMMTHGGALRGEEGGGWNLDGGILGKYL